MADSRVDKSIQQLITMFGDSTKIEKVWENASLSSNFSAQTISLNLAKYQLVLIVCLLGSGYETVSIGRVGHKGLVGSPNENVNATNTNYVRRYTTTEKAINFETGYFNNQKYDKYTKPIEIYGLKGVR